MRKKEEKNQCVYDLEILRARINIRDYYINTAVSGIYESTGQLLSLIRVRLAMIENKVKEDLKESVSETSQLAGSVIRDLRDMSRNFYPENELLKEGGLIRALQGTVSNLFKGHENRIETDGTPFPLLNNSGTLLFNLALQILLDLKNGNYLHALYIKVYYAKSKISLGITYTGDAFIQLNTKQLKIVAVTIKKKKIRANINEILLSLPLVTHEAGQ